MPIEIKPEGGLAPSNAAALRRHTTVASLVVALAICMATVALRVNHPSFSRPVHTDELITLQNHTWAGVNADGSRRPLRTTADLKSIGPCGPTRLALGAYASLGRWSEPNNHVAHSLLTNVTLLGPWEPITAGRIAALGAGSLFAMLMAFLCVSCGAPLVAPLAALFSLWHPYVLLYSQEGRGYALMLALCLALVLALRSLAVRPDSLPRGAVVAGIAILTFFNLVNLSVDWTIPILLAAAAWPWLMSEPGIQRSPRLWRKTLAIILLAVGAVGFIFLMDRLPGVVSSARQYGIPWSNLADLRAFANEARQAFAPGVGWSLVLLVGAGGAVAMLFDPRWRFIPGLWLFAAAATAAHFVAAHKFSFVRNLGYMLPPLLLGFTYVVHSGLQTIKQPRGQIAGAAIALICLIAWLCAAAQQDIIDHPYVELELALQAIDRETQGQAVLLLGYGVADMARLKLAVIAPSQYPWPNSKLLEIVVVEKHAFPFKWTGGDELAESPLLARWSDAKHSDVGPYRIYRLPAIARDPASPPRDAAAIGVWAPPLDLVALSDEAALEALAAAKLPYAPRYGFEQVKLNVFGRLIAVYINLAGESEASRGPPAHNRLAATVAKYGGRLTILVPPYDR